MGSHIVSHCHCAIRSHVRALTAEQFFFVEQSAFNQRNKKTRKDMTKVKGKRKLLSTPRWKWRDYGPFFSKCVWLCVCSCFFFQKRDESGYAGRWTIDSSCAPWLGGYRRGRDVHAWILLLLVRRGRFSLSLFSIVMTPFVLRCCCCCSIYLRVWIWIFECLRVKKKTSKQTNSKFIRLSTQKSTLLSCNIT